MMTVRFTNAQNAYMNHSLSNLNLVSFDRLPAEHIICYIWLESNERVANHSYRDVKFTILIIVFGNICNHRFDFINLGCNLSLKSSWVDSVVQYFNIYHLLLKNKSLDNHLYACHTPKCEWGCNERIPKENMHDHVKICKQRTESWNKVNHFSLLSVFKNVQFTIFYLDSR